jgi:presenilin-like A22 family membrane protease
MNNILEIFKNPESQSVLFNYCDILIFIIIFSFTLIFTKKKLIKEKIMLNILLFSYLIVIPSISLESETNNSQEIVDSFNSFYLFFKLPIWWILGILNILYMYKIILKNEN